MYPNDSALRTTDRFALLVLSLPDNPNQKKPRGNHTAFNDNTIRPVLVLHGGLIVPCLRECLHGAICVKCTFTRYGGQFVGEVDFDGRYTR